LSAFFSILVPVCNQEGKMKACLESIKNQSFDDFEVIFVDDGSSDNSFSELSLFASSDSRVTIIRHETNKSLLAARYTGMLNAKGQYVLFLDSDDNIEPDTCEVLHNTLLKNKADIVRFGFTFEPMGKEVIPIESDDLIRDYMEGKIYPAIWKNCYSKAVIDKLLESSESFYCNMGEDTCLAGLLFSCADSFVSIDNILYHYDCGSGMSNQNTGLNIKKIERDLDSIRASEAHLKDFIAKYNPEYIELTERACRTMYRYILRQHVYLAKSLTDAIAALKVFDTEELSEYYEYGCNIMLVSKIKRENGLDEEELDIKQ